jgi:hypothetical protein
MWNCLRSEVFSEMGSGKGNATLAMDNALNHSLAVIARLVRNCALGRAIEYSSAAAIGR